MGVSVAVGQGLRLRSKRILSEKKCNNGIFAKAKLDDSRDQLAKTAKAVVFFP